MEFVTKIIGTGQVTHDVKWFRLEKPAGYTFHPGQATEISINEKDWLNEKRPFTFTGLNEDSYLEFTIKRYPDHHGVTDTLHRLITGNELILRDVWGAIEYKGPGYFIAGGAGITPFVAILRKLYHDGNVDGNKLFFSNKTAEDIIYETELRTILGPQAHFVLTKEERKTYPKTRIDKVFLQRQVTDFQRPFYVCGPDKMVSEINDLLKEMGASPEALVFEK